ncbi:MAG: hypothetical protein A4E65_00012 [Syntrophorhabdus sp. PtaU1.Bin153]|nr:MAG: hypothetical protein A4E65_00012 [Syntrophorhabdus sp. PtaU1.Bin153]
MRYAAAWMPPEVRWQILKAYARQPTICQLVYDALAGIERDSLAINGSTVVIRNFKYVWYS